MRTHAFRNKPSHLGRVILRRLFDATPHKPRPHVLFPESSSEKKPDAPEKPAT